MKLNIEPDFESLLPPLTEVELEQLEKNLLEDEAAFPKIVVWENHKNTIIDGHNQYRLRTKLGLPIKVRKLHFDTRDEALRYSLEIQLGRRNMTASQLAMLATRFPAKPKGRPSKNAPAGTLSQEQAAAVTGSSRRAVQRAASVRKRGSKALTRAVEDGTVTVRDAEMVLDRPVSQQAKAVKKVRRGEAATAAEAVSEFDKLAKEAEVEATVDISAEDRMAAWNKEVEAFARSITALKDKAPAGGWWDESQAGIVAQQLKSAAGSARQAKCDHVCPLCHGDGCDRCKSTGFMPRRTYEMAGGK